MNQAARIAGTAAVTAGVALAICAAGTAIDRRATDRPDHHQAVARAATWTAAWRTAPEPPLPTGPSNDGFNAQTIRIVTAVGVSGQAVRVRLSNRYGSTPLVIGDASVAVQRSGPVTVGLHEVTFAGARTITIPAGADTVSDPVQLPTRAGQRLAVSLYLPHATGPVTWHQLAHVTSYVSGAGDWTAEPGGSPFQTITSSSYLVDGVDVLGRPAAGTVVAFGDSITDGSFSTMDGYATYPDWLARQLTGFSVLNEGIGGNRLLGDTAGGGAAGLHRFEQDVLDQPSVTDVVLLEGVNDIGAGATADQLIAALTDLVGQAHQRCVAVIGGTLTPFAGSVYDSPEHEQTREAVNAWIRSSGTFDAVADFDAAIRDPAQPLTIAPEYHTVGDLHPNDEGYRRMAQTAATALRKVRTACPSR